VRVSELVRHILSNDYHNFYLQKRGFHNEKTALFLYLSHYCNLSIIKLVYFTLQHCDSHLLMFRFLWLLYICGVRVRRKSTPIFFYSVFAWNFKAKKYQLI